MTIILIQRTDIKTLRQVRYAADRGRMGGGEWAFFTQLHDLSSSPGASGRDGVESLR